MVVVAEAIARLACSRPTVLDPRQSALVKGNAACRGVPPANHTVVTLEQAHECDDGEQNGPVGEEIPRCRDEQQDSDSKGGKTRERQPAVEPGPSPVFVRA